MTPGPEGGTLFFMPRTGRLVPGAHGKPHHVTQRGNNNPAAFSVDNDQGTSPSLAGPDGQAAGKFIPLLGNVETTPKYGIVLNFRCHLTACACRAVRQENERT